MTNNRLSELIGWMAPLNGIKCLVVMNATGERSRQLCRTVYGQSCSPQRLMGRKSLQQK
jgi:hypothetical protein